MRTSQFPPATLKETPTETKIISHQLMLRAGLIHNLASGLYTWLPYGLRVLHKVQAIVREEMNRAGGVEVLMPGVQPAELWEESGRWEQYGPELLRINDRHGRDFCLGPTHEEIVTDLARRQLKSYKQLPINYYQIQTKFRDEVRPRFGIMRAREFLMKDAYSFHSSPESLQQTYDVMYETYSRIFTRLGLDFRPVEADTGSIGGNASHEFHVLASSGEDAIAFSTDSDYAANVELAEAVAPSDERPAPAADMHTVATPNERSIDEVSALLNVPASHCLKVLLVQGEEDGVVALVLRGDHELNELKAEKLPGIAAPLTLATAEQVQATAGCEPGFIGPVGLNCPLFVDRSAAHAANFICGANRNGEHLQSVNWGRDLPEPDNIVDIRNVVEGDASPDGHGTLQIKRGIEVGHIFQLGEKYSTALNANVLDENGKARTMSMGCYGIGVSRVVAAAIEQNHDDNGIIWPYAIAPFSVGIACIGYHKNDAVRAAADQLYADLQNAGIDVLLDDRNARPGVMFADMELLGLPHRITLGARSLENGVVEYQHRRGSEKQEIAVGDIVGFLQKA